MDNDGDFQGPPHGDDPPPPGNGDGGDRRPYDQIEAENAELRQQLEVVRRAYANLRRLHRNLRVAWQRFVGMFEDTTVPPTTSVLFLVVTTTFHDHFRDHGRENGLNRPITFLLSHTILIAGH
jgi:hypothetical protein